MMHLAPDGGEHTTGNLGTDTEFEVLSQRERDSHPLFAFSQSFGYHEFNVCTTLGETTIVSRAGDGVSPGGSHWLDRPALAQRLERSAMPAVSPQKPACRARSRCTRSCEPGPNGTGLVTRKPVV